MGRPIRFLVRDMELALGLAAEDASKETVDLFKKLSSGTLSRAAAAALDYPYAQRHGFPRRDPNRINVLTDRFRQAWKAKRLGAGRYVVYNDSTVAKWLEFGTKGFRGKRGANSGMIARKINKGFEVETKMAIIRQKALHRRLRALLG
jgi:hypothetical protein